MKTEEKGGSGTAGLTIVGKTRERHEGLEEENFPWV